MPKIGQKYDDLLFFAHRQGSSKSRYFIRALEFGDGIQELSGTVLTRGTSVSWQYPIEFVSTSHGSDERLRNHLRELATGFTLCEFDCELLDDEVLISRLGQPLAQHMKRVRAQFFKGSIVHLAAFQFGMIWERIGVPAEECAGLTTTENAIAVAIETPLQDGDFLSVRIGANGPLGCLALRRKNLDGSFIADMFSAQLINDSTNSEIVSTHTGAIGGHFTKISTTIGFMQEIA